MSDDSVDKKSLSSKAVFFAGTVPLKDSRYDLFLPKQSFQVEEDCYRAHMENPV